ncbi:hypothetical protein ACJMK2_012637 [Sinanodonta woodiana]|uniref:Guanylyl cyclase n=1 Tax=Sinanodonta woodiana TaxID=1069815 RepID=A0ABD3V8U3_SINWO
MAESKVVHNVPTCIQSYSWDCGLACSSMVLRYLGFDPHNVYTSDLDSLQCGESIWTIDLAMLLQKYDIRHKLCTITIGVDKTYSKERFYKRRFTSDEERVNKLFEVAFTQGLIIEKRSVTMEEIIEHIQLGNIAVFLIDWNYLECIWCDRHRCRTCMCFPCLSACCDGYQGHYVVVCGFDLKKKRIFYKNPAFDTELCCSGMDKFDIARKSYGTDEDVLFVYKDGKS